MLPIHPELIHTHSTDTQRVHVKSAHVNICKHIKTHNNPFTLGFEILMQIENPSVALHYIKTGANGDK